MIFGFKKGTTTGFFVLQKDNSRFQNGFRFRKTNFVLFRKGNFRLEETHTFVKKALFGFKRGKVLIQRRALSELKRAIIGFKRDAVLTKKAFVVFEKGDFRSQMGHSSYKNGLCRVSKRRFSVSKEPLFLQR